MAYLITYEQGKAEKKPIVNPALKFLALGCALILIFLYAQVFQDAFAVLLHPMTDPVAQTAWAEMTGRIEDGEPVPEALEVFCRQILDHGRVP